MSPEKGKIEAGHGIRYPEAWVAGKEQHLQLGPDTHGVSGHW